MSSLHHSVFPCAQVVRRPYVLLYENEKDPVSLAECGIFPYNYSLVTRIEHTVMIHVILKHAKDKKLLTLLAKNVVLVCCIALNSQGTKFFLRLSSFYLHK